MPRVLIVDDSPTEILKFKVVLEQHGYEVLEANNGTEGVRCAKEQQPDVVLMDIVMPGINGFQATRQITKNNETAHIPVIIVTTKGQDTDRVWGKRQGAKGYLTKPVEEKTLIDTISEVIKDTALSLK